MVLQQQAEFGQMYPLVETCSGQVWYYFGQADLWSDGPPLDEAVGQVDISSDFVLARLLFFPHSIPISDDKSSL